MVHGSFMHVIVQILLGIKFDINYVGTLYICEWDPYEQHSKFEGHSKILESPSIQSDPTMLLLLLPNAMEIF